jgi:hypothetical protein
MTFPKKVSLFCQKWHFLRNWANFNGVVQQVYYSDLWEKYWTQAN